MVWQTGISPTVYNTFYNHRKFCVDNHSVIQCVRMVLWYHVLGSYSLVLQEVTLDAVGNPLGGHKVVFLPVGTLQCPQPRYPGQVSAGQTAEGGRGRRALNVYQPQLSKIQRPT